MALPTSLEYLCYVSTTIINSLPFQCEDRLQTSESDVYRRQLLTSKVDPRAERVDGTPTTMFVDLAAVTKKQLAKLLMKHPPQKNPAANQPKLPVNPLITELSNLNFQLLEVVSCYRDTFYICEI